MTKQEIINAINATIVANGQKGITAESLNNILTEMVNATPEGGSGGGDGLLKVYIPDMYLSPLFAELGGFNMDNFIQIKAMLEESGLSLDMLDVYENVVNEYLDANALVYQTLVQKAQSKEGAAVLIDMSKAMSLGSLLMYDPTGQYGFSINISCGLIGSANVESINGEASITISFANTELNKLYGYIGLNADGSLTFEPYTSEDAAFTLIIPADGETLDDDSIESNANFAYAINNYGGETLGAAKIVVRFLKYGNLNFMTAATLLTYEVDSSGFKGTYLDGITVKQVEVSEDGTTVVNAIGTLTA